MAISADLELSIARIEKFQQENPNTWAHILRNWDIIKAAIETGAAATDVSALQAQLAALQAQVDAIVLTPGPQGDPGAAGEDGEDGEPGLSGANGTFIPPPGGTNQQVLTHGPGGDFDFFWADNAGSGDIYAPMVTGDQMTDEILQPQAIVGEGNTFVMGLVG